MPKFEPQHLFEIFNASSRQPRIIRSVFDVELPLNIEAIQSTFTEKETVMLVLRRKKDEEIQHLQTGESSVLRRLSLTGPGALERTNSKIIKLRPHSVSSAEQCNDICDLVL